MSRPRLLQDVYSNTAVREFGRALRIALWQQKDFSSLVDFDGAERPEDFAEALKRFLRRFDSLARRQKFHRPSRQSLEEVMMLIDAHGVKLVRAAIISHALVGSSAQVGEASDSVPEGEAGNGDEL